MNIGGTLVENGLRIFIRCFTVFLSERISSPVDLELYSDDSSYAYPINSNVSGMLYL